MRQCVLVVGMHRSGTSVMAGALKIMGVDFGEKFLGYDTGNVKGHFEHTDILDANNAILAEFGSRWDDPEPLPDGWYLDSRVEAHKEAIRRVIARDFAAFGFFGIKEPRVSILLPLYADILREMSVEPLFVIMERPFAEIAESLYRRDKIPAERSLRLCEKYRDAVVSFTADKKSVRVNFDEFLGSPEAEMKRVERALGIRLKDFGAAKEEIFRHIDPNLKHFKNGKITPMTVKNRITKMIDAVLPFHTRRRRFVKNAIQSLRIQKHNCHSEVAEGDRRISKP